MDDCCGCGDGALRVAAGRTATEKAERRRHQPDHVLHVHFRAGMVGVVRFSDEQSLPDPHEFRRFPRELDHNLPRDPLQKAVLE